MRRPAFFANCARAPCGRRARGARCVRETAARPGYGFALRTVQSALARSGRARSAGSLSKIRRNRTGLCCEIPHTISVFKLACFSFSAAARGCSGDAPASGDRLDQDRRNPLALLACMWVQIRQSNLAVERRGQGSLKSWSAIGRVFAGHDRTASPVPPVPPAMSSR
jgi:hypothetical protein